VGNGKAAGRHVAVLLMAPGPKMEGGNASGKRNLL